MTSKIFIFIATLASSTCFAHQVNNPVDNELMDIIEANKYTCVSRYSEDKIYLHPSKIFPTERGVYLNVSDEEYILLPTLNSDSNGCYLPCVEILNTCPGCGLKYLISCKNPDCPLIQRREENEREKERTREEKKKEREQDKQKKKK